MTALPMPPSLEAALLLARAAAIAALLWAVLAAPGLISAQASAIG